MARNTSATEATTSKRKFGVNTSNIPTAAPTIVDGWYVGNLKNIKVDGPDKQRASWLEIEDLQLFDVVEEITGKKGSRVHTGNYYVSGVITYMAELANIPGVQDLPMDTMTIFGGRVDIHFAKDEEGNWGFDNSVNDFGVKNRTLVAFQKATGITDDMMNETLEAVPFDYDEVIPVPERLQGVEGVEDMLAACKFYKLFFLLLAERISGVYVKVNVSRRSRGDGTDDLVNEINTGSFGSSCGLLAVEVSE
jgi:hypothetical protein